MQPVRIAVAVSVAGLSFWMLLGLPAAGAPTGTIRGRVINQTTGAGAAGVKVILSSGTASQDEVTSTEQVTDTRGRYLFEDLPTGADRFYAVDAVFDSGIFPGRAITIPDDTDEPPVIDSTLRVWNTTTDPSVLVIGRDDIFVSPSEEGGVGVVESVRIANLSDLAYVGRGADDAGAEPGSVATVGFALPSDADNRQVSIVDSDLDIPGLLSTEYGFAITVALPPGETQITFSYPVEGLTGSFDLSRRALYPVASLQVFASSPLEVQSNRLSASGEVDVGGRSYDRYTADGDLDAGDPLQVVAVAEAGTPLGLVAGMAGVLALVAIAGAVPFVRSRRKKQVAPKTREDLIRAIAELDHAHENGAIETDVWAARRAELKAELADRAGDKVTT